MTEVLLVVGFCALAFFALRIWLRARRFEIAFAAPHVAAAVDFWKTRLRHFDDARPITETQRESFALLLRYSLASAYAAKGKFPLFGHFYHQPYNEGPCPLIFAAAVEANVVSVYGEDYLKSLLPHGRMKIDKGVVTVDYFTDQPLQVFPEVEHTAD